MMAAVMVATLPIVVVGVVTRRRARERLLRGRRPAKDIRQPTGNPINEAVLRRLAVAMAAAMAVAACTSSAFQVVLVKGRVAMVMVGVWRRGWRRGRAPNAG